MTKRIRDALQQQALAAAKKPKLDTAEKETSFCSTTATANVDHDLTTSAATTMIAGSGSTGSSIRWRRLLWLCGMGLEDLVLGWFPFSEEDFAGQACWDDDDVDGQLQPFDDIWQIKHIQEIPNTT